jgi:predicted glycosyl hydrolase (DUF1957 family)
MEKVKEFAQDTKDKAKYGFEDAKEKLGTQSTMETTANKAGYEFEKAKEKVKEGVSQK